MGISQKVKTNLTYFITYIWLKGGGHWDVVHTGMETDADSFASAVESVGFCTCGSIIL